MKMARIYLTPPVYGYATFLEDGNFNSDTIENESGDESEGVNKDEANEILKTPNKEIEQKSKDSDFEETCPDCHTSTIIHQCACKICIECGWSACD